MPTDNITILYYLMLSWIISGRHVMSFSLEWFCLVDGTPPGNRVKAALFNLIRVNSPQLAAKDLFLIEVFDTP
jgi:hypothetical protein